MIQLEWPWLLLLAALPWLLRRVLPPAPRSVGRALRLPHFDAVAALARDGADGRRGRRTTLALATLIWLLLLLAATRPQWLGDPINLPLAGRDLVMAVDVSGSMEIPDLDPAGQQVTRLDVVKAVADRFIEGRSGDRIGLILFGSRAYLQTPLTFDRTTVRTMLAEAQIGIAGKETAIGDAIGLAIKRLRDAPADRRILLLLTDGANTAGEVAPRQAARLAAEHGVRIYTIGLGAERMRVDGLFGSRVVNPSADLDEATLKAIAETTGGAYFRARDGAALATIYGELERLEPVQRDSRTYRPATALFMWPLGAALLLSVLLAGLRDSKRNARDVGIRH